MILHTFWFKDQWALITIFVDNILKTVEIYFWTTVSFDDKKIVGYLCSVRVEFVKVTEYWQQNGTGDVVGKYKTNKKRTMTFAIENDMYVVTSQQYFSILWNKKGVSLFFIHAFQGSW